MHTITEIFDQLEPLALAEFTGDSPVMVAFYVYTDEGLHIVHNFGAPPNAYVSAVRQIAKDLDAYAVATIAEVRMVPAAQGTPRSAFPANLREAPECIEALMVMVEHRDGIMTSKALIERERPGDEMSHGTLKEFVRETPESVGPGRLQKLLPGARGN